MADEIDPSTWKPRRTRGTASYKIRNYFALAVIGVGAITGLVLHLTSVSNKLKTSVQEYSKRTEEEIDRKLLFQMIPVKRSDYIKAHLERERNE